MTLSESVVTKSDQWLDNELFSCISPYLMDYLEDDELDYLMHSYSTFLEGVDVVNGSAIFDRLPAWNFAVIDMDPSTRGVNDHRMSLLLGLELTARSILHHLMQDQE